jgi:hypothetical protein
MNCCLIDRLFLEIGAGNFGRVMGENPFLELSKNQVLLEICFPTVVLVSFPHTQHMTMTVLKSSISSHEGAAWLIHCIKTE